MQVFSILLFFCICSLTRSHNNPFIILVLAFISDLLLIARIKLYILFGRPDKAKRRQRVLSALFVIVLSLAALTAWALFINIPFGKIKTWGYLKDEDVISADELESQVKEEQEVSLQEEQIQAELTRLTFQLTSTDEMYQVLASTQDLLVKEEPYACDVGKAEMKILGMLHGLDVAQGERKAAELSDSVKTYVDNKILKNLARIKNNISKTIEDNRVGLWQKIDILSSVNKIEYSNSFSGINKHSEQLRTALNEASISDVGRKQLKQLGKEFREWKSYQAYRKKFDALQEAIKGLEENKKQDFNELSQQISDMDRTSESGLIDKKLGKMRGAGSPGEEKLINRGEEILNLKKEMVAFKENSQLRKELESSGQASGKPYDLEAVLNTAEESNDPEEVAKQISGLLEKMRQANDSQMPSEAKNMLEAKLEDLIKEAAEAAKKQIKESNLSNSGEGLLGELMKMSSGRREDQVTSAASKMQKSLDTLYKQGNITKDARDNLVKKTENLQQLLAAKLELAAMGKGEGSLGKSSSVDYKEKLSDLFQSSLQQGQQTGSEQQELMDKLMDKLNNAQSVSQVDDVLKALNQELASLEKKTGSKDTEKMKDLIQKAAEAKKSFIVGKDSRDLRMKIETLKNVLPQQAALLEKNLDKLSESKNKKELSASMSALDELFTSKQLETIFKTDGSLNVSEEEGEQEESLKIYLLPNYAILPLQSTIVLKSVVIYDNSIREFGPELEWFSSKPSIASVNQHGLVYARGIGDAEIICRYRGTVSRKCKVTVVEVIPDYEAERIRSQLEE